MTKGPAATARAVALAGPCGAGKTQLMEALLFAAGAIPAVGRADTGERVGDRSPEARAAGMSTDLNVAGLEYLGDRYWILDTPGSVEFSADGRFALAAADVAVIVAEPDPDKAVALQMALREVEELGVPAMLFVNKIDQARGRVRDLLEALQEVSAKPLVMRQIPIWEGERVAGFIDLALERAYVYRPGRPSQRVDIPSDLANREADARFQMLERLADFDDALMELLLEDAEPDRETVFADLTEDLRTQRITPVFLGSAIDGSGARRLLKALRHETPALDGAAVRVFGEQVPASAAYVIKTRHLGQAGKQSIARVLTGGLAEGDSVSTQDGSTARASGLARPAAGKPEKIAKAAPGDVVLLGRVNAARTGQGLAVDAPAPAPLVDSADRAPVFAQAVVARDRAGEVKLTEAVAKLLEEDPGLEFGADLETGEIVLRGQGDRHLAHALARLKRVYGVDLESRTPATPYRETMRRSAEVRGRHKKQSGGHGQYGDVVITAKPRARGEGFAFDTAISGGVVPRQYFPAVKAGVEDAMQKGPLGFPVVDVAVTLTDGSHHSVDSSEIAFRTAGRIAMSQALQDGRPVLLEPIWRVVIHTPEDCIAGVTRAVATRGGRVLGFDARPGWAGWDDLEAELAHAALADLIVELRSVSQGAARFSARFDHYSEVEDKRAAQLASAEA